MNAGTSFKVGGAQPVDRRYQLRASTVTALPGNQADGTVIRYKATAVATGAASNVWWTLAYDATDAYWYPVGAPSPLTAEIDAAAGETTASTSYTNLATSGPGFTLPLAGDYLFTYGCFAFDTSTNAAIMSVDFGSGAADADEVLVTGTGAISVARTRRKTGFAASSAILSKYRTGPAGTATFAFRWLTATPIRVH